MHQIIRKSNIDFSFIFETTALTDIKIRRRDPQHDVLAVAADMQVDFASHHLADVHGGRHGVRADLFHDHVLRTAAHNDLPGAVILRAQSVLDALRQDDLRVVALHGIRVAGSDQLRVKEVHLGHSDKAGDKDVRGMVKDLLRSADLHDVAVAHDNDPVAQRHGLRLVMCHVDKGGIHALAQLDDLRAHLVSQLRVQIGQGLVHQENLRLTDDGAPDRDALPLAAGQSLRLAFEILGDVKDARGPLDPLVDLVLRHLAQLQRKGHIFVHRHMRVQRVVLEDHRDVAVLRLYVVHQFVVDIQLAAGDLLQTGDHSQRRRFTAAGGTDKNDKFLILDIQIESVYGGFLAPMIRFYDILQVQSCHIFQS